MVIDLPTGVDSPDAIEVLQQIKQKLTEFARLKRENGLAFYTPHAKQEAFHRAGDKKYRYVRTGNRFGKSQMGAAEDCAMALGARIWWPEGDPGRTVGIPKHPTKGIIVTTDWDKSREVFSEHEHGELGKLFQYLPPASVKSVRKNSNRAAERIVIARPTELGGGESVIYLDTVQSFKQNNMSQESSVWDWAHIDEPCPKPMFDAISRGFMDRAGKCWFTCTPLTELWINDMFIPSRRTKLNERGVYIANDKKWMTTGSSYDNPYVSKEAINDKIAEEGLNEAQIQTRIYGTPLELSGLVYKEFDYDRHVYRDVPKGWVAPDRPPKSYTVRLAIDPHPAKQHAVLFVATSPYGHNYFFEELWVHDLIPDLAKAILAVTADYYLHDSLVDPIANTENPVDGTTMRDQFSAFGVWCVNAVKDPNAGILKVRQFLKKEVINNDRSLSPFLQFSENLPRTLFEFDHFVYDPDTNKPLKENDDMMENLYRLCLTDLEYVDPKDGPVRKGKRDITSELIAGYLDEDFQDGAEDGESILSTRFETHRARMRRKYNDAY